MRKKQMLYHKNRGFTLVEVIIVVVIMGILAAIALPSYTNTIRRNQVAKAARSFENTLILAQRNAFVSGRSVTICPVANITVEHPACSGGWGTLADSTQSGWIAFNDRDGDLIRDAADPLVTGSVEEVVFDRSTFSSDRVAMQWTNNGRPNIVLTARNTSGTSGTMRIYSPSHHGDTLESWGAGSAHPALNDDNHEVRVRVSSLGKITYEK